MTLACLHRVGRLLGSAALLALGCGRVVVVPGDSDGETTGSSTSTDDGGHTSSSGGDTSGGTDSSVGTSGGSTDSSSGTSGGSTGSSDGTSADNTSDASSSDATTTSTEALPPPPPCGVVLLAYVANGIGGFAMDGESEGDIAGRSVSSAGDVNGDGLDDVVVAAPGADVNHAENAGRVYVVFGKTDTDTMALADVAQGQGGFAMDGETLNDHVGASVSGAGDVNGDGLEDVVVGAPSFDPSEHYDYTSGRVYVAFGKADTDRVLLSDVAEGIGGFATQGGSWGGAEGRSVCGAGDINGDGLADVALGAPGVSGIGRTGRAYVVFGKASTDLVYLYEIDDGIGGFALEGEAEDDSAGISVSGVGDINDDGVPDVVVGAYGALEREQYNLGAGRTYVAFGKGAAAAVSLAEMTLGNGGFAMDGEAAGDVSGVSVSGAGDVNGDGIPDVIVGAPRADPNGIAEAGRSYVVFGKTDTEKLDLSDVALGNGGFILDGETEADYSGSSVSRAGDVNGDGLADVIIGARGADPSGHAQYGRAYVVFGKTDTEPVSLADVAQGIGGFVIDGETAGDNWGFSVSGGRDINDDGVPDIIVGAGGANPNGDDSGRAYVVFGGDFSCDGG